MRIVVRGLQDLQCELAKELAAGTQACQEEVMAFVQPLERATAAKVNCVRAALDAHAALVDRLEALKQKTASVE